MLQCHRDADSLEKIALEYLPNCSKSSWKDSGLGNTDTKAKVCTHFPLQVNHERLNRFQILSSFESTFCCSIPNQDLASINTFTDLLQILEDISQQEEAPKLFPNIKDDGTLPPNLSIQFINTAPKVKPNRRPFQNYDARRPEHAQFLSKAEKEKRKQKRRHLTALK